MEFALTDMDENPLTQEDAMTRIEFLVHVEGESYARWALREGDEWTVEKREAGNVSKRLGRVRPSGDEFQPIDYGQRGHNPKSPRHSLFEAIVALA